MIAWWEASIVVYIKVVRRSYDGRAMSYDPRLSLATSYDHRWIVWRRRTSIAKKSCDEPRRRTMSYDVVRDVVRHRTIILRYPTWTRIAASFCTWPKTAKTSWDWPPITATSYNVVQRRATSHNVHPMVRDHSQFTHRRWSWDVLMVGVTTSYKI